MNSTRPSHFSVSLATALFLLLALLIGEVTIRISMPVDRWKFRDATEDWRIDKRLGWVQKPGLDVTTTTEFGWTVRFRTNRDGLTPPTARRERKAETIRIMFVGDSTVVGRSIPQDKTVNAQLESFLQEKGVPAEALNAGVQGYSTDQVLLRMEELLPLYRPDVVIYGACDNDFGGNVSRVAYGQAKPMFRLKENGELEEIQPDLQPGVRSFGGGLKKGLQYSALYRFLQPKLVVLRARMGRWEERNLLGIAPEIYYEPGSLDRINWRIFSALVKKMKQVSEEKHAQFFFYSNPAIAEIWDPYIRDTVKKQRLQPGQYDPYALERRFKEAAGQTGAEFIPLIDYFLTRQSEGPFHLLPRDPHSNPRGNELTARVLGSRILQKL